MSKYFNFLTLTWSCILIFSLGIGAISSFAGFLISFGLIGGITASISHCSKRPKDW